MSQYGAIISGTGSYLPEKRLTNDDLSKMVDTNDEWIMQRTGIKERRMAAANETTAELATIAGKRAMEAAGLSPHDIGLVIVATVTADTIFPSCACQVAYRLGTNHTGGMDLSAACTGFIYALHTGAGFVRTGMYKHVLVIGAETLTRVVDYTDRASCIIFGDGAGAVVLSRTDDTSKGVVYGQLYSDGGPLSEAMILSNGNRRHPITQETILAGDQYMKIRGREVYKFAVSKFEELIKDAMDKASLTPETLSLIVPHQVNQRIIDSAMEKLNLPTSKAYVNIEKYGNTSAASIPIALDEATKAGQTPPGSNLVMVAFGGGLTWGNAVIRM